MKLLPVLAFILVFLGASNEALAKKKRHHHKAPQANDTSQTLSKEQAGPKAEVKAEEANPAEEKAAEGGPEEEGKPAQGKKALDFDFFGGKSAEAASAAAGGATTDAQTDELERAAHTRRWMLKTHQTLGIITWALMAATVTVGQLNYNQLYGGGGGKNTWQTPHEILVLSTSVTFAATAAFALFAPTPYKKPLHFDTGLIHRIAVIGATLGMVTEGVLGWWTTHQANAGNPNNLGRMAQIHQVVGYTTFGFMTIAGAVWLF